MPNTFGSTSLEPRVPRGLSTTGCSLPAHYPQEVHERMGRQAGGLVRESLVPIRSVVNVLRTLALVLTEELNLLLQY